ncbi:MAG: cupin domain-containing protein [Euryarchaeota archaeon]|nr:cupin domain-containing protein [Euryarchaeota archaeon]
MRLEPGDWIERGSYRKRLLVRGELGKEVVVQLVQIPVGKRVGKHYHRHQTEFYYILRGSAELRIGNQVHRAERGEAYVCLPGEVHSVDNRSGKEPFELLVLKLNYRGEDSVWLEGER